MKRIEICTNDEWYRVFGPLDCSAEDDTEEATKEYQRVAIDRLEMDDRTADLEIVTAQGQRMMCHGWNGAQWKNRVTGAGYHIGGIGTFEALTPDEIGAIDDAHEAASEAANKLLEEPHVCHLKMIRDDGSVVKETFHFSLDYTKVCEVHLVEGELRYYGLSNAPGVVVTGNLSFTLEKHS